MSFTDAKLISYNQQGLIAGPEETAEQFEKRIGYLEQLIKDPDGFFQKIDNNKSFSLKNKITKPLWSWTRTHLRQLFDVAPTYFVGFYQNKNLSFFEGAATWILSVGEHNTQIPMLQVKEGLRKGSYLRIYNLDEILSHEAIHAMRASFNEPKYEEIFAYMTSSSSLRRILGPMIQSSREIYLFLGLMFTSVFFQMLSIIFYEPLLTTLSFISAISAAAWVFLGFMRLFKKRFRFFRAYKKLFSLFNKKKTALSVLFRLRDKEIDQFAKSNKEQIKKFFEENQGSSIRLKQIYLSYF